MRISTHSDVDNSSKTMVQNATTDQVIKKDYLKTTDIETESIAESNSSEVSKEKLQQAVDSVNQFLEVNHNTSKFVFHEGLERYYIQIVNRDTDEVIKEIPPKKLLNAFYEMQKLVGMIVDEKV